jgi:hypothetical protein
MATMKLMFNWMAAVGALIAGLLWIQSARVKILASQTENERDAGGMIPARIPLRRIGIWSVSMMVVFAALAPALKRQYEREYDSGIQFKESPEIDWWYSFLIRRDCTKMRDYLHELKIPIPEGIPPIGVQHGQAASEKYELSADPNVPVYRREILISERDALEGNIRAFTDRYADYVMLIDLMMKELKQHGPKQHGPANTQSVNLFYAESAFGPYFNWSFWGENKGSSVSAWSDYFWNLKDEVW